MARLLQACWPRLPRFRRRRHSDPHRAGDAARLDQRGLHRDGPVAQPRRLGAAAAAGWRRAGAGAAATWAPWRWRYRRRRTPVRRKRVAPRPIQASARGGAATGPDALFRRKSSHARRHPSAIPVPASPPWRERLPRAAGAAVLDLDTVAWGAGPDRRAARARHRRRAGLLRRAGRLGGRGLYAELIAATLPQRPLLVFLDPAWRTCRRTAAHARGSRALVRGPPSRPRACPSCSTGVAAYYRRDGDVAGRTRRTVRRLCRTQAPPHAVADAAQGAALWQALGA